MQSLFLCLPNPQTAGKHFQDLDLLSTMHCNQKDAGFETHVFGSCAFCLIPVGVANADFFQVRTCHLSPEFIQTDDYTI